MEKLFQVSNEEHGEATAPVMNVMTAIDYEEEAIAIAIEEASVAQDVAVMNIAEEEVLALEGLVADSDKALADGDVTPATARFSASSLTRAAVALGLPKEELAVSHESADTDPAMTLKVSNESAKDIIKKAIVQLRKMYVKLNAKLRKITAQVIGSMSGFEKKANSLEAELKDVKFDSGAEFSKSTGEALGKRYAILSLVYGEKNISGSIIKGLNSTTTLHGAKLTKELNGLLRKKSVKNIIKDINITDKIPAVVLDLLKKDDNASKLYKRIDEGAALASAYRWDGDSVKFMVVDVVDSVNGTSTKIYTKSAAVDSKDLPTLTAVPNVAELKDILKVVSGTSKDLKNINKSMFDTVDDAEKVFEDSAKDASSDNAKDEDKETYEVAKSLYTTAPKVAFGAVMGIYGQMRNALSVVSEAVKVGKKKKEEK